MHVWTYNLVICSYTFPVVGNSAKGVAPNFNLHSIDMDVVQSQLCSLKGVPSNSTPHVNPTLIASEGLAAAG